MMEYPRTVAEWIEWAAGRLSGAGLHFGHGTDNAGDEAAWLVLHAMGVSPDGRFNDWGRGVGHAEETEIRRLVEARCSSGMPLAYLTGTAYFAGLEFEAGPDALVPRSPIAELIEDGFRPWLDPDRIRRVLDLCTGGGCIAIATAVRLPQARVDATDISDAALRLAARNAERHGVSARVRLIRSDVFESVPPARYDLIVANPPYVPEGDLPGLPREYRSEPGLGLASGGDGLDAALEILHSASSFLAPGGILVCEVGESEQRLATVLPGVPFLWLEFARGGSGVFVLDGPQLEAARPVVSDLLRNRKNVA